MRSSASRRRSGSPRRSQSKPGVRWRRPHNQRRTERLLLFAQRTAMPAARQLAWGFAVVQRFRVSHSLPKPSRPRRRSGDSMSNQSFADLGMSRPVTDAIARRGITEAFPIQQAVIADVLAGRDVLMRSPTGSGKTLAFALPLVELVKSSDPCPTALVLAPTRELATQIAGEMSEIAAAR